ncbi:dTDP-4-amino-4,6-dideoxygalactose transaminase [Micromonospora sp. Llam0]|uniref:DegT/DnrJ/EryC1/StrS family aminotransferase n=1 Tax=Micromonospora sp. Llam0 TaxID=2485143 RepID=UPI000F4A1AAB|nr:DegT/DnrJ/EryC1/StrS family aminotransferase [Micromonospora sp. Llam0]ROO59762.1 dTDP-4-amino-4,6-dideoxygalactose transaminase [Micromonospora sp. Llam0]
MDDQDYQVSFPVRGSVLDAAELAALTELVGSGQTLSAGSRRTVFERRFAEHVGTRHALSVTSGTVALELAIHLADLRPGDEVVTTPQTFSATIHPLVAHGVRVRFCDVDPASLNIDPTSVEAAVNDRTAAVILVHYGGYPAEMDRIVAAAHRYGAVVIEDCAHALGATWHGRRPGALGDIGCFSFHNSKNITTLGEGGMLTFDRDEWVERIDRIRSNQPDVELGPPRSPGPPPTPLLPWMRFSEEIYGCDYAHVRRPGTNATMSEAAAAVGIVQLDRLAVMTARRRYIANRLDECIGRYAQVRLHHPPAGVGHAYHLYTFFVEAGRATREHLVRELDRRGVEVQLRYFPLHLTPEWRARGHRPGECPVAERLWFDQQINLPCHPAITDAQLDYLVEAVSAALDMTLSPVDSSPPASLVPLTDHTVTPA